MNHTTAAAIVQRLRDHKATRPVTTHALARWLGTTPLHIFEAARTSTELKLRMPPTKAVDRSTVELVCS